MDADPFPAWVEPMKAVLTDERFSDAGWVFERKLDGIRCLAFRDPDGAVRLRSRNRLGLEARFPSIAEALGAEERSFVVDGEVVAFAGSRTSFERLGSRSAAVYYYVFDLLWLDGRDTTGLPLRERKGLLRKALRFAGHVRFTPHRNREGEALYRHACAHGWEGIIAKRADSPYARGRSKSWLKFKCDAEQELVIGGFTAPKGSREHLGALLVGTYEDGELRYAGKVGTGFDRATLADLHARLEPTLDTPFADEVREPRVTWVRPELVAQVGFTEWTRDGRLRHPRYLGLREDKAPRDVVRERPV